MYKYTQIRSCTLCNQFAHSSLYILTNWDENFVKIWVYVYGIIYGIIYWFTQFYIDLYNHEKFVKLKIKIETLIKQCLWTNTETITS